MKIAFIRHGQTEYNKAGRATGWANTPLSEEGVVYTQKLALEIQSDFTYIYSADLVRYKQTTEILNKKLNLSICYDTRLRERNFGSLEGTLILDLDPMIREKDKLQTYDYRPYDGESVDDVKVRVFSFIKEICREKPNEKILVITSGGIIRLLHNVINNEVYEVIQNSSIHEFDFDEDFLKN